MLAELHVRFALDSLEMVEPFFVVDVRGPGAVSHHRADRSWLRVGSDPACDIVLPGAVPTQVLLCTNRGFLWNRRRHVASGDEIVVGEHTLRPTLVRGADAVFTSEPPPLHGHAGRWEQSGLYSHTVLYTGMAIPVAFTGGLLACSGFLRHLYVHMGFHPAWKFEHVEELLFENGRLENRTNVSDKLADVRETLAKSALAPGPRADRAEIAAWIERVFELDY